LDFEAI